MFQTYMYIQAPTHPHTHIYIYIYFFFFPELTSLSVVETLSLANTHEEKNKMAVQKTQYS